jgi:hypothetical protein
VLYDGPEGKVELEANGYCVLPHGIAECEGRAWPYRLLNPSTAVELAPDDLAGWIAVAQELPDEDAISTRPTLVDLKPYAERAMEDQEQLRASAKRRSHWSW